MERFIIQKSELHPDSWVCTDRENMLMAVFTTGKFNETQDFKFLEEPKTFEPTKLARLANEMAEWLIKNHSDKIM